MSTLRKSYSLSDLSETDMTCSQDEVSKSASLNGLLNKCFTHPKLSEMPRTQRIVRSRNPATRSTSINRTESEMYFSEIDVTTKAKDTNLR